MRVSGGIPSEAADVEAPGFRCRFPPVDAGSPDSRSLKASHGIVVECKRVLCHDWIVGGNLGFEVVDTVPLLVV